MKNISIIYNFEKGVLQSSKNTTGDFPFITAAEDIKTHNEYYYDTEALCFAFAASGSLGRTHYYKGKFIASDLVYILTPNKEYENKVDLKFHYFFLNHFKDEIVRMSKSGTSKISINREAFSKIKIPVPLLSEQRIIVKQFEEVKTKLEQIKELRAEQEKEIQSLMFSIFTDAENSFSKSKFGSLLIPSDNFEEPEMGKNYRQVGVRWWGGGVYERETIDGSQTSYKSFVRLEKNNFLFNKIWVRHGALAVVKDDTIDCYASGEFPVYCFDVSVIHPNWIDFIINLPVFWQRCSNLSQGTSGKNRIKPNEFLKMEIPVPPIEEQNRIVALLDKLNAVKTNHTQTGKELAQLMPALLDKAFKGEL